MRNPKSQQMKPDKLILDEIKYFIEARKKNDQSDTLQTQVQSMNPCTNINMSPSSIDVNNAVTVLLGLGVSNVSSEYENVFNKQTHDSTDVINIRTSDDLVNNDDSNSIDDSDYDSDLSTNNKDTGGEQNDDEIRNKGEMKKVDQDLYTKSLFITRVEIDHMLSISGLTSFNLLSPREVR